MAAALLAIKFAPKQGVEANQIVKSDKNAESLLPTTTKALEDAPDADDMFLRVVKNDQLRNGDDGWVL